MRVFVTKELHPFSPGGIGRVIANILTTSTEEERKRTFVLHVGGALDPARCAATYPGVRFGTLELSDVAFVSDDGRRYPPFETDRGSSFHRESIAVMRALTRIGREQGLLEYVELCDWAGPAFAAIQQKRLGLDFARTTLAVRLHSTESILAAFENRALDPATYDLERKALERCDVVVAQLPSIAAHVREFFGLDAPSFERRLVIDPPPVLLDFPEDARSTVRPTRSTPIVFSSKLQDFKRPDIFLGAVIGLLESDSAYDGDVHLLAHALDADYAERMHALVPDRFASRVRMRAHTEPRDRQRIISESICVFPSVYESFCLAAYEASLSGAVCILNGSNPGFDETSPWQDGVNCLKFDGSTGGLRALLGRVIAGDVPALSKVTVPVGSHPWDSPPDARGVVEPTHGDVVSVVIAHANRPDDLRRCLDSVFAGTHAELEVVIADASGDAPRARDLLERMEVAGDGAIRVVRASSASSRGALYNAALPAATSDVLVFMSARATVSPDFLTEAVRAFRSNPEIAFIVPQAEQAAGSGDTVEALTRSDDFVTYIGNANASGLKQNLCLGPVFAVRRAHVDAHPFPETAVADLHWEYGLSATHAGAEIAVTSTLDCAWHESLADEPAADTRAAMPPARLRTVRVGAVTVPLVSVLDPIAPPEPEPEPEIPADALTHPTGTLGSTIDGTLRKLRKLTRSPQAFFEDSKSPLLRDMARFIPTHRRSE